MNVAIALIVACRAALSIVRSICARRATATAPLTIPQTEARNACSKLNAASTESLINELERIAFGRDVEAREAAKRAALGIREPA